MLIHVHFSVIWRLFSYLREAEPARVVEVGHASWSRRQRRPPGHPPPPPHDHHHDYRYDGLEFDSGGPWTMEEEKIHDARIVDLAESCIRV